MSSKSKKIAIASGLGAIAIALVVGLIVLLMNTVWKSPTQAEIINDSAPGQAINSLTTVNGEPAAAVVVAPPTAEWWWVLGTYSPNPVAYGLDFNKYTTGSKYIAYSLSPGADFKSYGMLGLPTTFIIYNDMDASNAAASVLQDDGVPHQLVENVIFFVPEGAYSDVNYALNQYKMAESSNDLDLNNKAMMFMGFKSFKTFMNASIEDDLSKETFSTLSALMGVTEDTYWSGVSADGYNWRGSFSNFVDPSELASPRDVQQYAENRRYIIKPDGSKVLPSETGEESGVIDPGTSTLFSSGVMEIRSNTEVAGPKENGGASDGSTDAKYIAQPLPESEGAYQININDVNRWISTMLGSSGSMGYTTFKSLSITVQKDGSSTLNITLLPEIIGSKP